MNLYQIKFDRYDGNEYGQIFMLHEKQMESNELQKYIELARFDMGHHDQYESLPKYLEKYGFKRIIIGYYED